MRLRSLLALVLVAAGLTAATAEGRVAPGVRLVALRAGSEPVSTPFPLSHVGVQWVGREDAAIEVRTGTPGQFGPWQRLGVAHDLGDEGAGLHLSGLARADGATVVQVRAGAGARRVEVVAIDATSAPPPTTAPVVEPAPAPGPPEIVTRAGWGADEGMRTGVPEYARPQKLVVHHTVTPNDDPDPASTVRAVYAYHTRQNGWNDIGYHYLVDAAGRVYEGRFARPYAPGEAPTEEDHEGRAVIGAHAKSHNVGSMGVALLGEFSGDAQPSPAAMDSLVRLLAWKADRHGIDPHGSDPFTRTDGSQVAFPNLAGHRDLVPTGCPGGRLYDRLPEVRDRVAAAVQRVPAPPPPLPPPPPVPLFPGFWTVDAAGRVLARG
ncbi:MAG: N-acetylmuramoyl-L-alanine amidase, partial [Acidimicrobiia bacterium]